MTRCLLALALALVGGCGKSGGSHAAAAKRDDVGSAAAAAAEASPEVAPLVLGLPTIESYRYRQRPGNDAFKRAREAEAAGTWSAVVAACREALAADPLHLDASYLLAVALAKTGAEPAAIAAPLTVAVGGDFLKWGAAALAQPALQGFLGTPLGKEWAARVSEARTALGGVLPRALIVTGYGDLYAFDREANRVHRLTRIRTVNAAYRARGQSSLVYLTRQRKNGETLLGVGTIDLASARTRRAAPLPFAELVSVAYNRRQVNAYMVYAKDWLSIDDSADTVVLHELAKTLHAGYPAYLTDMARLDVRGRHATLVHAQLVGLDADRDEHELASAVRIGSTRRVVTVPSPGMIDASTATLSPDRSQLAFVAQLTDNCKPGEPTSAVFVADTSTGTARELARASAKGMAVEWVADRVVAIAGDDGVTIHVLTGDAAPVPLAGADGLASPRRAPACRGEPTEPVELVEDGPDDDSGNP